MDDDIKKLLEALYKMSQDENWNESHAQELIVWGAELYNKYYNNEKATEIGTN